MSDWEVKLTFKIHGSGRIGADGIGFWYKDSPDFSGDKAYGGPASWKGLLIAMDTFDNTNGRSSPKIIGMYNDGTKEYNAGDNGRALSVGSCGPNFRNQKYELYVRYLSSQKRVEVRYKPDGSSGEPTECFSASVDLPVGYYFGMTAATGGLADNHDVYQFVATDMSNGGGEANSNIFANNDFRREKSGDYVTDDAMRRQRRKMFAESSADPVANYKNSVYRKVDTFDENIEKLFTGDHRTDKLKKDVVNAVLAAVTERTHKMLDDVNYQSDAAKVNEYKNKIASFDRTVQSILDRIKKVDSGFADVQEETIGKIKSKSSHTFIIFVVIVQVVVAYIFFSWKNSQKKSEDNYLGFY